MVRTDDRLFLWHQILDVARLTPSPHNVQPWRMKLLSTTDAELYIDGTRTLPNEDVTGSFLLSAMGMFLEALEQLAAHHGHSLTCDLDATPEAFAACTSDRSYKGLTLFARLHLTPDAGRPDVVDDEEAEGRGWV